MCIYFLGATSVMMEAMAVEVVAEIVVVGSVEGMDRGNEGGGGKRLGMLVSQAWLQLVHVSCLSLSCPSFH
jgi:hypothetical protein